MNSNKQIAEINACERISSLIDDRMVGEALSTEDQTAIERHLHACDSCRKVEEGMSLFSSIAIPVAKKDASNTIEGGMDLFYRKQQRNRIAVTTGLAVAIAASLLLLIPLFDQPQNTITAKESQSCKASTPLELQKGVWMSFCTAQQPSSHIDKNGNIVVDLQSGMVGISADPNRPMKNSISVSTRFGTAQVVGTVFSVQIVKNDARLEVFRGTVRIRSNEVHRQPFLINEGNGAWFASGQVFETDGTSSFPLLLNLLAASPLDDRDSHGVPTAASSPMKNMDSQSLPSTVPYTETEKSDTQSQSEPAENSQRPNGDSGTPSVDSRKHSASYTYTHQKAKPAVRKQLRTLIQEARSCLIDKNWTGAESKYHQILRHYSKEWEAVSTLVSLANIELHHLGKTREALSHYAAYKRRYPNGTLLEESVFGMAEAYRRLGNPQKERKTLETFIAGHPKSAAVPKARKRLNELKNAN